MRYDITYRCHFDYDGAVAESQNELRAAPATDATQTVHHARVSTTPSARVLTTTDYWGTRVDSFGIRAPHHELTVLVEATVDAGPPPHVAARVPTSALADQEFVDEHRELLGPSPLVVATPRVVELAQQVRSDTEDDVVPLARACCRAVADAVARAQGATEVGTPVGEVLDGGAGACQDRAHLLIALVRTLAIPARYVSGYVTDEETCDAASTHAWVEVAVPGEGWHSLDPCTDAVPHDERVVIGRGRDYGDVSPLRGTYVGGEAQPPTVEVLVEPVVRVG